MLNIPNQIITLFKTDSVRKNFRVIFPNGECTDLTNDDIVAGTVQFTESICSKDVLQFGLAESSRIQFECVNVPNVYGAVIECAIEIDTSSLSTADITSIQANQGDGVLVLENDSDIGFGYYRVPYGTFTITSCPRSSGAMWKRRVEAYTQIKDGESFIKDAIAFGSSRPSLDVNLFALAVGTSNNDLGILTDNGTIPMVQQAPSWTTTADWWIDAENYYSFEIDSATVYEATSPSYVVARITCEFDTTGMQQVYDDLKSYGAPDDDVELAKALLQPHYTFYLTGRPPELHAFGNPNDTGYMPYFDLFTSFSFVVPITVNASLKLNGTTIKSYTFTNVSNNVVMKDYVLSNNVLNLVNASYEPTNTRSDGRKTYIDTANLNDIYNGALELLALFGKCGRNGANDYVGLSKASPVAVDPEEYASLWWDEFDISPIGSILITYNDIDVGQEQTIEYTFGGGLSTYDLTNNYILKNLALSATNDLSGQSLSDFVTSLLDTYFVPNVADIAFTPVQLDALGLPYLESGDYLEIDDGNGGTVGTYIMNHTITGEQLLMDNVESKGGEIIGNVRSA